MDGTSSLTGNSHASSSSSRCVRTLVWVSSFTATGAAIAPSVSPGERLVLPGHLHRPDRPRPLAFTGFVGRPTHHVGAAPAAPAAPSGALSDVAPGKPTVAPPTLFPTVGQAVAAEGGWSLPERRDEQQQRLFSSGPAIWQAAGSSSSSAGVDDQSLCSYARFNVSGPGIICPDECPYMKHEESLGGCKFSCVIGSKCDESSNFADNDSKTCRGCGVKGCKTCVANETRCDKCSDGFRLANDGTECLDTFMPIWYAAYSLLLTAFGVFVLWYCSLHFRPIINRSVLERAIRRRGYANLRGESEGRELHPLTTNLCRTGPGGVPIGGPTVLLHFNFQAAVLLWCVLATLGWLLAAAAFSWELLTSGLEAPKNIFELCDADRRFDSAMESTMNVFAGKATYTVVLYVVSTVLSLLFAVRQRRRFTALDAQSATMKDYAVCLQGFPADVGPNVEKERVDFIEDACGYRPLGVSVCWNFIDRQEEVDQLIEEETHAWNERRDSCGAAERERHQAAASTVAAAQDSCWLDEGLLARFSRWGDIAWVFLFSGIHLDDEGGKHAEESSAERAERIKHLVSNMRSTQYMYAVFRSEYERNEVSDYFSRPLSRPTKLFRNLHRITVTFSGRSTEPEGVLWENFPLDRRAKFRQMILAVCKILLVLLAWGVCCYWPYAAWEAANYSALGQEPDKWGEYTFTLVVVVGNQLTYMACEYAVGCVGFRFVGHRLAFYSRLYMLAILLNLLIDMYLFFQTSQTEMLKMNIGLEELFKLTVTETDPIQVKIGKRLYDYNFPNCFLFPFMAEALFCVILKYHINKLIIATRPVNQHVADTCLLPLSMDLSRYADIALNVTQATVALYFSSGHVLWTLLGLLAGHSLVYVWDHYRVLRHMESCRISSFRPESVAQEMMVFPCASLAGCLVWMSYESSNIGLEGRVLFNILAAFVVHLTIHLYVLRYLLYTWSKVEHPPVQLEYKEMAKRYPANWFNMNPIHCLRSRYLHRDEPPCIYYVRGKEHLLEVNPRIHLHYSSHRWNESGSRMLEMSANLAPWAELEERRAEEAFSRGAQAQRRTSDSAEVVVENVLVEDEDEDEDRCSDALGSAGTGDPSTSASTSASSASASEQTEQSERSKAQRSLLLRETFRRSARQVAGGSIASPSRLPAGWLAAIDHVEQQQRELQELRQQQQRW